MINIIISENYIKKNIIFFLVVKKKIKRPKNFKNWTFEKRAKRMSEHYKHADNLYHSRFNFFMIAESMFILSFATAVAAVINVPDLPSMYFLIFPIIFLGLGFSLAWLYTNARLSLRVDYLIQRLKKRDNIFWDYLYSVKGLYASTVLSYFLPIMFTLFWGYLLFYLLLGWSYGLALYITWFLFGVLLIAVKVYLLANYNDELRIIDKN